MLVYLLQVNVVWALCFVLYRLCRGHDTFFKLRRVLLLGIVAFALMFPFLNFQFSLSPSQATAVETVQQEVWLPAVSMVEQAEEGGGSLALTIIVIYILISSVLLLRFAVQILGVMRVIRRSTLQHASYERGLKCRLLSSGMAPFSFFRWLCVPPELQETDFLPHVLRHEAVHIRQWHSADTCLLSVLCALCWFNPASWLTLSELRDLHEYIADGDASRSNARSYQYALLGLKPCQAAASVANSFTLPQAREANAGSRFKGLVQWFNVLPLKKRILMINKRRTHGAWRSKYLLLAPAALILTIFNQPINASVEEAVRPALVEAERLAADHTLAFLPESQPATSSYVEQAEVEAEEVPSILSEEILFSDSLVRDTALFIVSNEPLIVIDGKVVDSDILSMIRPELIESMTVLKGEAATSQWGPRGKYGAIVVTTKKTAQSPQVAASETFSSDKAARQEVKPQFPGGDVALQRFIAQNVHYPKSAQEKGIQGSVLVSIIVGTQGQVTVTGVTGVEDESLRAAAMDAVGKIPYMKPGSVGGKPAAMTMHIPVSFLLR